MYFAEISLILYLGDFLTSQWFWKISSYFLFTGTVPTSNLFQFIFRFCIMFMGFLFVLLSVIFTWLLTIFWKLYEYTMFMLDVYLHNSMLCFLFHEYVRRKIHGVNERKITISLFLFSHSTRLLAATTLRNVLGTKVYMLTSRYIYLLYVAHSFSLMLITIIL